MKDDKVRPFGVEFLEDAPDMAWGMEAAAAVEVRCKKRIFYTTGTLNPSDEVTDQAWVSDDVVAN